MMQGFMRFLVVVNLGLAGALLGGAVWLYQQDYGTRELERQIRTLQRATTLEEETIRRLEIEWQRLRNPMRLEPLARLKLNLMPPDPLTVMTQQQALAMLPLRPPPVEAVEQAEEAGPAENGGSDAEALSALAEQAAQPEAEVPASEALRPGNGAAVPAATGAEETAVEDAPRTDDALGNLINGIMHNGGGQP